MREKNLLLDVLTYIFLILGVASILFPLYYTLVAATLSLDQVTHIPMQLVPGTELFANLSSAWTKAQLGTKLMNSFTIAVLITVGKISISILSAFAVTYFEFPFRKFFFWMIFITLMLPVEVRILPTYEVMANVFSPLKALGQLLGFEVKVSFSLLDSYAGLTLPLIASATATFLFRQFFMTLPEELCEAAKMDGATPMQFFRKVIFPLSKTNIAALTVITFVYGWNQYLWPLLMTTKPELKSAMLGLQQLIPTADEVPQWNVAMAGTLIVLLPPVLMVVLMQRWFVKGLVENEK
jgi:sn-glycerol 3-phosphate transport system permease protein